MVAMVAAARRADLAAARRLALFVPVVLVGGRPVSSMLHSCASFHRSQFSEEELSYRGHVYCPRKRKAKLFLHQQTHASLLRPRVREARRDAARSRSDLRCLGLASKSPETCECDHLRFPTLHSTYVQWLEGRSDGRGAAADQRGNMITIG